MTLALYMMQHENRCRLNRDRVIAWRTLHGNIKSTIYIAYALRKH